jgi:hypothetical protein
METRAYWPTRIMLAAAIVVVAADVALAPFIIWPPMTMGGSDTVLFFGLPTTVVQGVSALGLGLGGLMWMVRIFRGPRNEPPAWRYRDH